MCENKNDDDDDDDDNIINLYKQYVKMHSRTIGCTQKPPQWKLQPTDKQVVESHYRT